jgi:hypothetical protein
MLAVVMALAAPWARNDLIASMIEIVRFAMLTCVVVAFVKDKLDTTTGVALLMVCP